MDRDGVMRGAVIGLVIVAPFWLMVGWLLWR